MTERELFNNLYEQYIRNRMITLVGYDNLTLDEALVQASSEFEKILDNEPVSDTALFIYNVLENKFFG